MTIDRCDPPQHWPPYSVWSNCNLYAYFILDWVNEWHCNFLLRNTFFPFSSLKHDKELELFAQNTAKQLSNVPRSLWADHILVVSYFRSNDFLFYFQNFQDVISLKQIIGQTFVHGLGLVSTSLTNTLKIWNQLSTFQQLFQYWCDVGCK